MIRYDDRAPDPAAYFRLFESTGWNETYHVTSEDLARAVRASWRVVCAYQDSELIGGGRVVSDGVLYAAIFDVIVHPDFQKQGVGTEIMNRLLTVCRESGIRDILLFAARGTQDFYQRFGFKRRADEAPGMMIRLC